MLTRDTCINDIYRLTIVAFRESSSVQLSEGYPATCTHRKKCSLTALRWHTNAWDIFKTLTQNAPLLAVMHAVVTVSVPLLEIVSCNVVCSSLRELTHDAMLHRVSGP